MHSQHPITVAVHPDGTIAVTGVSDVFDFLQPSAGSPTFDRERFVALFEALLHG